MNNAYYILAKEAVPIERLHICTWEFPDADSYIEFGIEFSFEKFVEYIAKRIPLIALK